MFVDIDDCIGVMCNNGGLCVDSLNDFSCSCVEGFAGQHCDKGNPAFKSVCNIPIY